MLKLFKALGLVFLLTTPTLSQSRAIVGATVVNLDGGAPLSNAVVLIDGERISSIGNKDNVRIPLGTDVVRADGMWLLPGLMNMHVHLGLILPGKLAVELADETDGELALRMAHNARLSLEAGITTVRLPGDERHGDLALRKAMARGYATGPRIYSGGEMVDITAGHGADGETHDGPDALIRAVRREIAAGADWIKIAISGGIASDKGGIAAALMNKEEIHAVIDTAHRLGRKVTAHSGSPAATHDAIDAGIDCIEHGYFLTREVLRRMKQHGVWFVPTAVVSQPATLPFFERIGSPPWYLERVRSVGKSHWEALKKAIEEGVNIALGTDQFPFEPNDGTLATVREAEYYVEAGMTPLAAIRAATIQPAILLGINETLGTIEVGKLADIIAISADPTANIQALRDIRFVMQGGKVIRNDIGH